MNMAGTDAGHALIMPKLFGPCLSHEAHGTLARILTFLKTRRGAVLKKRASPRDPATFNQRYRRWMFFFLQSNWGALEEVDKQSWSDLADFYNVSINNAYLGTNMERWDRFQVPSAYLPIQQSGAPGTIAVFAAAKENNRIKITLDLAAINQNWGMILYFTRGFPPQFIPQHVIQINLQNNVQPHYYYHYPQQTGFHWFKISLFTHNGERYDYPVARFVNWT